MLLARPLYCDGGGFAAAAAHTSNAGPGTLTVSNQSRGIVGNISYIFRFFINSLRFIRTSFHSSIHYLGTGLKTVFRPLTIEQVRTRIRYLRVPVRYLETVLRIPFIGARIGLSTVLGIIPFVGTAVTTVLAAYPIILASQIPDLPGDVFGKMCFNLVLGGALSLLPLVGGLLSNIWRPTSRNLR
ncbi:hypothetical protein DFS34DRAFT_604192 [Phlyctochytrium arcticum]|nr:hypothetical protein DFS34DRAFT_604192 [Phlyctochytrium arcticum]